MQLTRYFHVKVQNSFPHQNRLVHTLATKPFENSVALVKFILPKDMDVAAEVIFLAEITVKYFIALK